MLSYTMLLSNVSKHIGLRLKSVHNIFLLGNAMNDYEENKDTVYVIRQRASLLSWLLECCGKTSNMMPSQSEVAMAALMM